MRSTMAPTGDKRAVTSKKVELSSGAGARPYVQEHERYEPRRRRIGLCSSDSPREANHSATAQARREVQTDRLSSTIEIELEGSDVSRKKKVHIGTLDIIEDDVEKTHNVVGQGVGFYSRPIWIHT